MAASSSPVFGFATQQAASPAPSPFGASSSPFGASPFQIPQPQQQQQQQQQQAPSIAPQAGLGLVTNDRTPISYNTRWADIHPDSQKALQKIEERILEYRDESWRLDQCERLYDTTALNKGFELDAARISQELSGVGIAIEREQASLQELMKSAKDMLRNTEIVVRSFMMLCLRFPRPSAAATANAPGANPPTAFTSQTTVSDFYSGVPVKPSPFLQQSVAKFESRLLEYRQWVEELERLLLRNDKDDKGGSELSLLQSLPAVMKNVHDFFIYVAAEVESLHEYLESMRIAFLADQRRRGEDNDPFLEADRRETAKREAAAKRVHPSALKPSEPTTQAQSIGSTPASASGAFGTPIPGTGLPSAPTQSSSPFPALSSSTTSSFNASLFTPSAPSTAAMPSFYAPSTGTTPSLFGTGTTPSSAAVKPKPRSSRRK